MDTPHEARSDVLHYHEIMLEKALAVYNQWGIEPFHVIDIEIFYYDDDESKDVRCLCFYRIFGDFVVREAGENVDAIDKEVVPYMLIAAGQGFHVDFFNFSQQSLFSLYEKRRDQRQEWLKTQLITLEKIEQMAKQFHSLIALKQMYDNVEFANKQSLKRYHNRHRDRWEPYVARVLAHDPKLRAPVAYPVQPKAKEEEDSREDHQSL
jgi:hypothetical protein